MTTLANCHPAYAKYLPDWELMDDANEGERRVKERGSVYLPPTSGQVLDGALEGRDPGKSAYAAYVSRAVFPDFVSGAIETLVGILDAKPAEITLPPELEYLIDRATFNGEGLQMALRRIHVYQLEKGRVGLLADMPSVVTDINTKPYIAIYDGTDIINWDSGSTGTDDTTYDKLNLVVLNESGQVRSEDGFSWKQEERYRVLQLGRLTENEPTGAYKFGVFDSASGLGYSETLMTSALYRGTALDEIPFQFINTKDILPTPDRPPLLPLARLCMTIYRGEADYRQNLYMQGQDTLVVMGSLGNNNLSTDDAIRTGAGARIDVQLGGDVKYIGVNSGGLAEQAKALDSDKELAAVRSGQLLAPGKMSMESGEALKTRVAAQTATLTSIARCSCEALERLLQTIAKWIGADPKAVRVRPNLDFTNMSIQGQDIVQLMTAKNLGYPISHRTLHDVARERGLTHKTFEEELKDLEDDPKLLIERAALLAGGAQGNNPVEQAGGPKKSTAGVKKQTSVPTK